MRRARPTQEKASQLETELIHARMSLAFAQKVITLRGHAGWEAVQERVKGILEGTESSLADFEKLTPEQRVILLKEKKDFTLFRGIVDDIEADLPRLEERLANAQRAFDDYRGKLNTTSL